MDYLLVFLAGIARLLPHPPNVTPVAAMALFGGAFLSKRYALLYPLCIMVFSDVVLNPFLQVPLFLPESLFVYGSFLITGCLGLWARSRSTGVLYTTCCASAAQFYLVTNFGTWWVSGLYPRSGEGLLKCYLLALPFFRNSLLGDLFWFSLLLAAYQVTHRLIPNREKVLR